MNIELARSEQKSLIAAEVALAPAICAPTILSSSSTLAIWGDESLQLLAGFVNGGL